MNKYSFWRLISEHRIEIPVIQRDYAQGRDTKKSESIRKSFVESIFNALTNQSPPIHLNFVYGKIKGLKDKNKIEENKRAIKLMLSAVEGYSKSLEMDVCCTINEQAAVDTTLNKTCFIPLDGQQRLTTLFLLHCYLLKRLSDEPTTKERLHKLKNFSYLIRPSTKQFCSKLIDQQITFNSNALSELISNASWFFRYWKRDPSVKGMLNMLDEIHHHGKELKKEQIINIVSHLIGPSENSPIAFELLNLDDFKMTDELYVKMNSRGKPLTTFEKFKSWLMEYIEENNIRVEIQAWTEKLDTAWLDLFWKHKDNDEKMLVDEEYMRFFRNMMQLSFLRENKIETSKDSQDKDQCDKNRQQAIRLTSNKGSDGEYDYIANDEYKSMGVLDEQSIGEIFESLELFERHKNDYTERVFKNFVTGKMVYEDKARFYATYHFLKQCAPTADEREFSRFIRVYENLIKNQDIDIDGLKTICAGIAKDSQNGFSDIYGTLVSGELQLAGFRGSQIKEERLKAALLLRDYERWDPVIKTAESHAFFNGQIGFIFALCGLLKNKDLDDIATYSEEQLGNLFVNFTRVLEGVLKLFDAAGFSDDEDHLFERALLTIDDFLYRSGQNRNGAIKYFLANGKRRDNSWHRILREYCESSHSDYKRAWDAFEKLVCSIVDDGRSLQDMIDNFKDASSWRYCFIKYPDTIDRCGTYRSFIDWGESNQYYLLAKADRRSDYCELESFHLFKSELEGQEMRFAPFISTRYYTCMSKDGYPCAVVDGYLLNGIELALDIRYRGWQENPWEISLFARNGDIQTAVQIGDLQGEWREEGEAGTRSYCLHLGTEKSLADIANKIVQIASSLSQADIHDE